jgi:hypothetical protein
MSRAFATGVLTVLVLCMASVSIGAGLIYLPAGLIVAGVLGIVAVYAVSYVVIGARRDEDS